MNVSNLRFCDKAEMGDLLGVVVKSVGVRLRSSPAMAAVSYETISPKSVGVVVEKKSRKSRTGQCYNWYRMVFQDFLEGRLVAGWVCANTSGLCLELLRRNAS